MLKGENIICFSSVDWGHVPTSKKHIMTILARQNRVLYVETFGSRGPGVSKMHAARIARRLRNSLGGVRRAGLDGELYVYSPVTLPGAGRLATRLDRTFVLWAMLRVVRKLKLENPILWYYIPTPVSLYGRFGEKIIVYHCVDEWSTYPGGKDHRLIELEKELLSKADVVFVSNRLLLERKRLLSQNAYYMPHGCDFAHFEAAMNPGPIPEEIARLPRPRIAMIGAVAKWVDWDLLARLATRHPEWTILLVGPVSYNVRLGSMSEVPNLHLLGLKQYDELPAYYRGVDACIIAFTGDEHIRYSAPTRILEHLAAGKPVITSDFPAAGEYDPALVKRAATPESFVRAVEHALSEDNPGLQAKRRQTASENRWEVRVEEMSAIISGRLGSRPAGA